MAQEQCGCTNRAAWKKGGCQQQGAGCPVGAPCRCWGTLEAGHSTLQKQQCRSIGTCIQCVRGWVTCQTSTPVGRESVLSFSLK